jgi:hypothetical protein
MRAFRQRRVTLHLTRGRGFSAVATGGAARRTSRSSSSASAFVRAPYTEEIPTDFENGQARSLR